MHELEMLTDDIAAMSFAGARKDIWHRLGQEFGEGPMTADEALVLSHWDREVKTVPLSSFVPDGVHWSIPEQHFVVLCGKTFEPEFGRVETIPDKIVGIHGKGGADAHESLTVRDRFLLAEEAIHASHGEAVWSTAGSLRGGTQGFATMEAPPTIIDPNGVRDIIRNYATITWSFDGSRTTELGASQIRVVCANTMAAHDNLRDVVIKVRHTSSTAAERMKLAAQHWALAQNEAKALKLQAERLLAVADGRQVLGKLIDKYDPRPVDGTKVQVTRWENRTDKIRALWHAPTNEPAVGNNGWAAWNTFVEYLDWVADVKSGDEDELERRLNIQFDGKNDALKANAADFILSLT